MERKLKTATAKLRNLKDFLTSTRNLNQGQGSSTEYQNNRKSSKGSTASGTLSVSLFDLVEPCSRPGSTSFTSCNGGSSINQNPNTSTSMFGRSLSELEDGRRSSKVVAQRSMELVPSKNPAIRLLYTIRSKFRKRKERGTKSMESADFGPFLSGSHSQVPFGRHSTDRLEGAHSVDQLYLGTTDDTFNPIGIRDRNYKENTVPRPRISAATSCFVIPHQPSSYRPSLSSPSTNLMDQSALTPPVRPSTALEVTVQPSTSTPSPVTPSRSPGQLKGLAKELFDLIHYGWYWGGLSKEEAEAKLKNEPDGAFVVRDSSSSVHILSLSFNSKGKTKHTRIDYIDGKFCFLTSDTEAFASVAELIEHWIQNSEQGIYCYSKSSRANGPTSYPVRLTKPISRFTEVKSLQFLSSFVLYQYTRLDLIPKLPLPPQLIEFISQQHYF